ncbi:MAG: hypothetical protein ACXVRE_11405 [Gaiellaceae bacterium]
MLRLAPVVAVLVLCAGASASGSSTRSWCRAPRPRTFDRLLAKSVIPLSRRASVLPIVGAGDGRSFFAQLYSPAFSGIARIDVRTSHVTRIRRFPNAHDDQADGSFDGRWLVWNEYHSLSDFFADFTTFAWDSRTGSVTQIGAATPKPGGGFWDSGWRQPDVRAGLATWTQGVGPDGQTEVHVYDLTTGVDRVVRHGHAQGSFFVAGPLVVWPESLSPGAFTRMLAADPRTGAAVSTPPALARLRGISTLFTDGRGLAHPSAQFTSLWWTGSLSSRAERVFKPARATNYLDNGVRIAGRYVIFSDTGTGYLADARTHRYLAFDASPLAIDRRALIVSTWTKRKTIHPRNRIMFVPVRSLPRLSRCLR